MTEQEATLILDISPTNNKGRRDAHRQITLLNTHTREHLLCNSQKKKNEAKDLLERRNKKIHQKVKFKNEVNVQ